MNSYGNNFRLTSFGESHGPAMGVVLDGLPAGLKFEESILLDFLNRRRPGSLPQLSARQEKDQPEILSGLFEGKTLGTPVACVVKNHDMRSEDYKNLKERRGHADQVWKEKYGHVDPRGGGRSSGRETLSRVIAGAFAKMALKEVFPELEVFAYADSIFNIKEDKALESPRQKRFSLGFLSEEKNLEAEGLLSQAKTEGESYGGIVALRVFNPPASLGEPVFNKLKSRIAEACLSIGAVNSFYLGKERVDFSVSKGTEFHHKEVSVYGGVLGGISTGEDIFCSLGVKPTSSILDVAKKGRHDPCILPRVLVVVEAMIYILLLDLYLERKKQK